MMFPETTQIWGKAFPGCMVFMKPGNASFFQRAVCAVTASPPFLFLLHQNPELEPAQRTAKVAIRRGPFVIEARASLHQPQGSAWNSSFGAMPPQ
ncbi:MAG: hypothetical protein ABSA42_19035 [Terracidiphilus sp.]|jgi:hypothetical protein